MLYFSLSPFPVSLLVVPVGLYSFVSQGLIFWYKEIPYKIPCFYREK